MKIYENENWLYTKIVEIRELAKYEKLAKKENWRNTKIGAARKMRNTKIGKKRKLVTSKFLKFS